MRIRNKEVYKYPIVILIDLLKKQDEYECIIF